MKPLPVTITFYQSPHLSTSYSQTTAASSEPAPSSWSPPAFALPQL